LVGSERQPFQVLTGTSAGAINATFLAARADEFYQATEELWGVWEALRFEQVMHIKAATLARIAGGWMRDLSFGGLTHRSRSTYLLDNAPLKELLEGVIDFHAIRTHLQEGRLSGVAVNATNYASGSAVTFFDTASPQQDWTRTNRISRLSELTVEHVMASASIPVFFPPTRLEGSFYGDGAIRMKSPMSPAIHMGCDRILAIGVHHPIPTEGLAQLNEQSFDDINIAHIMGVMLNASFLDALDADLERMQRINRTQNVLVSFEGATQPDHLREIPVHAVLPSADLGNVATEHVTTFPKTIRYLLGGLGAQGPRGADLLSYLAFTSWYTKPLLKLGYEDGIAQADAIREFLLLD
jgi:NTE family protein